MTKTFYNQEMEKLRKGISACINNQAKHMSSSQILQVLEAMRMEMAVQVQFDLFNCYKAAQADNLYKAKGEK